MNPKNLLIILGTGILLFSCNSNGPKNHSKIKTDTLKSQKIAVDSVPSLHNGQLPIFYNMYLSVEMSSLFKSIGATYNYKLLNSPDKVENYNASTNKAMNLGVYAVDLSYSKYFEQFDPAGRYLKDMHTLATDLGIPDNAFNLSVKRIETNIANKDSLIKIANEIYQTTDKYLKDNDRASSAALIILGGWTESMYIATHLNKNKPEDRELIERIAEQKHSLNDLINLLTKYKNLKVVSTFLIKLEDLKTSFATFNVNEKNMAQTYNQLKVISRKLTVIRNEIVS